MRNKKIFLITILLLLLILLTSCSRGTVRLARVALGNSAEGASADEERAKNNKILENAILTGNIDLCDELKDEGGIYTDCLIQSSYVTGDPKNCAKISKEKTRIQCEATALHDSYYVNYVNQEMFDCRICRQMVRGSDSDLVRECEQYAKVYTKCSGEGEELELCWLRDGIKAEYVKYEEKKCYGKHNTELINCIINDSNTLSHCKDTYLIKTWLKYNKLHR